MIKDFKKVIKNNSFVYSTYKAFKCLLIYSVVLFFLSMVIGIPIRMWALLKVAAVNGAFSLPTLVSFTIYCIKKPVKANKVSRDPLVVNNKLGSIKSRTDRNFVRSVNRTYYNAKPLVKKRVIGGKRGNNSE